MNCAGASGVGVSLFGANWNDSDVVGSRASNWNNEPWNSNGNISARGVCDQIKIFALGSLRQPRAITIKVVSHGDLRFGEYITRF